VKKTVEGIGECVKGVVELRPALLLRGLNCIGSASLKGASLTGSAHMIFASPDNFKRKPAALRISSLPRGLRGHGKRRNTLQIPPVRLGTTSAAPHWRV
jgi:hypothetical protein